MQHKGIALNVGKADGDTSETRAAFECEGAQQSAQVRSSSFQWKRGIEVPFFVSCNQAALQLCDSILAGNVGELPCVVVTEAVAVQVYILVVEQGAASQRSFGAVYVILASLAHKQLVA